MESISKKKSYLRSLRMNRKGIFGLENAVPFVLQLLVIGILFFAVIFILTVFNSSSILPAGSQGANDSAATFNNLSAGMRSFAANFPVFFSILVVVIVLLLFAVVLLVLRRFSGSVGGGGRGTVG